MIKQLFILLLFLCVNHSYAQKGIEKLTAHKVDSLQRIHVDTIMTYDSYCGECEIKGNKYSCYMRSGYTLDDNLIIYQQQGKFYILTFDCYNICTKSQLDECRSLPYFLKIIPTLKARDNYFKDQRKKGLFSGPTISDGGFEDAEIIVNKKKQFISISESAKTDLRDKNKKHYWVNKEIKLLKLITDDVTMNKKH